MKDLYAVLGIDANSSPTDIRAAYRKLSKKFHPDLNENDVYFENRFKEIRAAYELLNDPVGRAAYDNQLKQFRAYPSVVSTTPENLSKGSVNTKINWAFTVVLLAVTSLFGYYVVRSMAPSKITKAAANPDVAVNATPAVTHHKKHRKKALAAETSFTQKTARPFTDTISARTVKPSIARTLVPAVAVAEKPKPSPIAAVPAPKPVVKPDIPQLNPMPGQATTVLSARPAQQNQSPVASPKPTPVMAASNPTATDAYIKANATGIVYMRQMDTYNSDVVSSIPGDTKVTVLEKGNNFCKISYNNKTGYVPNWTVQFR
jgi:hypothetical protein